MATAVVKSSYHNITEVVGAPLNEDLTVTNSSGSIIYVGLCDDVTKGTYVRREIISQDANDDFKAVDGLVPVGLGEEKTITQPDASWQNDHPNAKWCLFERDKMLDATQVVEVL